MNHLTAIPPTNDTYQGNASIGGKQIGNYTVIPEYDAYKSSIKKSGVIIHEFLHTLGCPDLYWGGATGGEVPVGFWDMMSTVMRAPLPVGLYQISRSGVVPDTGNKNFPDRL